MSLHLAMLPVYEGLSFAAPRFPYTACASRVTSLQHWCRGVGVLDSIQRERTAFTSKSAVWNQIVPDCAIEHGPSFRGWRRENNRREPRLAVGSSRCWRWGER
jgi:hypothetical protein